MANNEILNFANSPTANVESQAAYDADPERPEGNQQGTVARSDFNNKLMLQTSSMCAGVGQYLAGAQALDVTDQLTPAQLNAMWQDSIKNTAKFSTSTFDMNESLLLDPNNLILNNTFYTNLTYASGDCFYFKARVANTGPMTVNINGRGVKNIVVPGPFQNPTGLPLATVPSSVQIGGMYFIAYNGTDFVLMNPTVRTSLFAQIALAIPQNIPGNNVAQVLNYDTTIKDVPSVPWVDLINDRIQPNIPGYYRVSATQLLRNFTGNQNDEIDCYITVTSNNPSINIRLSQIPTVGAAGPGTDFTLSGSAIVFLNGAQFIQSFVSANCSNPADSIEATSFYTNGGIQSLDVASLTLQYIGG